MLQEIVKTLQIGEVVAHQVLTMRESHELGRPSVLDVGFVLDTYQDPGDMIGQAAVLVFGFQGAATRSFAGIVESATIVGSGHLGLETRRFRYEARIVSPLALLDRVVDSRIFQDLDVKEIVSKVLEDHGITSDAVSWRLGASYPKRVYCVQYQESALAFVSRLLEEEGIYYFVEPDEDGKPILVFADDSTTAAPIEGDPVLPVVPRSLLDAPRDAIYALSEQHRVRSGKFVLRDYDFEKPNLDLTATAQAALGTDLEVYDHPGGYTQPAEGERLAKVRLEAEQARKRTVWIEAACVRISAGRKIEIENSGTADGEWVVTSVVHEHVDAAASSDRGITHRARATLVPADVKYRQPRRTPVPVIDGPQTARVVAPAGSPAETIHTDEHGRCKVKFHWDRSGPDDDKASCWMRVAQLQTSGSMVLPRIDWEVVVEFLEGNPDRPVVTGRLYNGMFMPPYALPEGKTRTSIKSNSTPGGGGSNEIRFEDKAGSEEIMIYSQYDTQWVAANNKKTNISNNETVVVKNNQSLEVGANQDVKITKGCQNTIGGSQTVTVGGNRNVEVNAVTALDVSGSSTTKVGGNQMEMDGNPLEALLALAAQKAAELAAAKAGEALARIQGQVDGAVAQVMGPINGLTSQGQTIAQGARALATGDLAAAGAVVTAASGLPGASAIAGMMAPGGRGPSGGLAATTAAPGTDGTTTGGAATGNALSAMATGALQRGVGRAAQALGNALGRDAAGGGSESQANTQGPAGDVEGVDATDREKGPGHSTTKVAGSHDEKVGSLKVTGALSAMNLNVAANMDRKVGAAHVEIVGGSRVESAEGNKTEQALGLVVLSKGGESEHVSGTKTATIGGAVLDKVKGSVVVEAGAPATFIGAFHKVEAKGKITFKCGGSEVVIDGGGVTITSAMVTIMAPKIQIPKAVTEV